MPKSPKKDLVSLVKSIAKKNKISIAPLKSVGISISPPKARPCGSGVKGKDRYTKSELVSLAKVYGVEPNLNMDGLCAALGINPRLDSVNVPKKNCGSSYRGDDRYTRSEVEVIARSMGIPVTGKNMNELCTAIGIDSSRVVSDELLQGPVNPNRLGDAPYRPISLGDMSRGALGPMLSSVRSPVTNIMLSRANIKDSGLIPGDLYSLLRDDEIEKLVKESGESVFPYVIKSSNILKLKSKVKDIVKNIMKDSSRPFPDILSNELRDIVNSIGVSLPSSSSSRKTPDSVESDLSSSLRSGGFSNIASQPATSIGSLSSGALGGDGPLAFPVPGSRRSKRQKR